MGQGLNYLSQYSDILPRGQPSGNCAGIGTWPTEVESGRCYSSSGKHKAMVLALRLGIASLPQSSPIAISYIIWRHPGRHCWNESSNQSAKEITVLWIWLEEAGRLRARVMIRKGCIGEWERRTECLGRSRIDHRQTVRSNATWDSAQRLKSRGREAAWSNGRYALFTWTPFSAPFYMHLKFLSNAPRSKSENTKIPQPANHAIQVATRCLILREIYGLCSYVLLSWHNIVCTSWPSLTSSCSSRDELMYDGFPLRPLRHGSPYLHRAQLHIKHRTEDQTKTPYTL